MSGQGELLFAPASELEKRESPRARRPGHVGVRVHGSIVDKEGRMCADIGLLGGLAWFRM